MKTHTMAVSIGLVAMAATVAAGVDRLPTRSASHGFWGLDEETPTGFVSAICLWESGDGVRLVTGGAVNMALDGAKSVPGQGAFGWSGKEWTAYGRDFAILYALLPFAEDAGDSVMLGAGWASRYGPDRGAPVVARWEGSRWRRLGDAFDGEPRVLAAGSPDGAHAFYVGGRFRTAGDVVLNGIGAWDGHAWQSLGPGVEGAVNALLLRTRSGGGELVVGIESTTQAGNRQAPDAAAGSVARWDGVAWSPMGASFDGPVHALVEFDAGVGAQLFAAGRFQSVGAVATGGIAEWDGQAWRPLEGGAPDGPCFALAVHDFGEGAELFAGGHFESVGGHRAHNLAAWNGHRWRNLQTGLSDAVLTLCSVEGSESLPDGLYAGGKFTYTTRSSQTLRITHWDGDTWNGLRSPSH